MVTFAMVLCKKIKERYREVNAKVIFKKGDIENLTFDNENIDLVMMNSSLHHLPNYGKCLNEINRILKRRGLFILGHEPNRLFFNNKLAKVLIYLFSKIGGRYAMSDDICEAVNERLLKENIIDEPLSKKKILALLETNSPTDQEVYLDTSKGFVLQELMEEYFKNYEILKTVEYTTFYYRKFMLDYPWLSSIFKFIYNIFFKKGILFSAVIRKK